MTMKNRDVFHKDPLSWHLVNEGVSSNNENREADLKTLRYELETFVCEGEYKSGLIKILQAFVQNFGQEQAGAWVSGFYGSGKSHLVKVLRYVWTDHKFSDGTAARNIATLPAEVTDLLKELSTLGKQHGGLHSAGGTLKAQAGDVRERVLGIIFQSVGLPEKISTARLMLDLRDEGTLEGIEEHIRKAGKEPDKEFAKIYTSAEFHKAYLHTHSNLGDTKAVAAAMLAQYPAKQTEVSIEDMVSLIRRALHREGKLPCTVIVLDEIQQFINNDPKLSNDVQEVAEAIQKQLDGRVMLVGTGQSALSETPSLQRLMGRFPNKTHLKDNDVENVVRTVVLRKKPDKHKDIEKVVANHEGEISRQLKSTKIASRNEDSECYVADYPLLPVRRRFWENVLHSIDHSGTLAQMRNQLRVTHEACKAVADQPLGSVIPGDFIYDQLTTEMLQSNELQRRFQEIIEDQKKKTDGELRARICSTVFLINKLRNQGSDQGVRATAEHIGDLLTTDLKESPAIIAKKVPELLTALATEGVLMFVDDEYRLQTTVGAEWENEYRRRLTTISNNDAQIAAQRSQLLSKAIREDLVGFKLLHGQAKEKRTVSVHHGADAPPPTDGLTVWVRDGFTENEQAIIQHIQGRDTSDPTVHVLVPKSKAQELKSSIASSLAAEETINSKGTPTTQEGTEALAGMKTRLHHEQGKVDGALAGVLGGARVFLSGGAEQSVITLKEAVQEACHSSLATLYPKFSIGDSANWGSVWTKAKEGNAGALQVVGHAGDADKHPVTAELLRFIGPGKKASDIYEKFKGSPYGWPKECLDACLAVLLESGHLAAKLNGQPIGLSQLDQRKIYQADYRIQHPVLGAAQKLRVKKLFKEVGHPFPAGEVDIAAASFAATMRGLADRAGGDPPDPEKPNSPLIIEIEGLGGNDLLFKLHEEADALTKLANDWKALAEKIVARKPAFERAKQLLAYAEAAGASVAETQRVALDSVIKNRALLTDPDPVAPISKDLGKALRTSLTDAQKHYEDVLSKEIGKLESQPVWAALSKEKKSALLASSGVVSKPAASTGTDEELLSALQAADLSSWKTQTDAVPTRVLAALSAAIAEAEPKAKRVSLPPATIKTEAELKEWLTKAEAAIKATLKDGPAIV
jgi:hypothetical protein